MKQHDEQMITLEEAREAVQEMYGRFPNVATVYRWCRFGLAKGQEIIRLESVRMGKRILTSRRAIREFGDALGYGAGTWNERGKLDEIQRRIDSFKAMIQSLEEELKTIIEDRTKRGAP